MMHFLVLMVHAVAQVAQPLPPLDAEGCVSVALQQSAQIERAQADVQRFEARLAQVQSSVYPKLHTMAFMAPMYSVRGSGFDREVQTRYSHIRDWGPYSNFEARVIQPLYSFGRSAAGIGAARERALVERARLEKARQGVAREVRKMYYTRLYARSLLPILENGQAIVAQVQKQAQHLAAAGTGEVSQVDLGRLAHGIAELQRRTAEAQAGVIVSLAALKHMMGLPESAEVQQLDERLLVPSDAAMATVDGPIDRLLQKANRQRPEWQELEHGQRAAIKLEQSERLAYAPVLALVGTFNAAWTPTRARDTNPYHFDIYNRLAGGAALALSLDLDAGLVKAKAQEAAMQGNQLRALQRFAATGIPLEVRQAYEGLQQLKTSLGACEQDVVATRKWMSFAKSAMAAGTGEARDLLDGLVAYLQAKQAHLAALTDWYAKHADLAYAIGATEPLYVHPDSIASGA